MKPWTPCEARISVGLAAAMLGYTAYLHALDYARGRPQGRPLGPAGKDPSQPQVPIIQHADVKRMMLAQKAYAEGALALNLYCARLIDEERTAADEDDRREGRSLLLEILTPVAKSWPSQWCLEGNALVIQVHGGYGYTRDYPVEQFYRDNRLNSIHEGTHGIQALDLLGRKVLMQDGAAFRLLGAGMEATIRRASRASRHPDTQRWAAMLGDRVRRVARTTQRAWAAGDAARTLANATAYIVAPAMNLVYADAEGFIGYQAAARIPIRAAGDGLSLVRGEDDAHEWVGYIPWDEMPSVFNPPDGLLATANSRITPRGYKYHAANQWASAHLTWRIYKVLESWIARGKKLTPADMLSLQTDVYSDFDHLLARELARPVLASNGASARAMRAAEILSSWDGSVTPDSTAAGLINLARRSMTKIVLEPRLGQVLEEKRLVA